MSEKSLDIVSLQKQLNFHKGRIEQFEKERKHQIAKFTLKIEKHQKIIADLQKSLGTIRK